MWGQTKNLPRARQARNWDLLDSHNPQKQNMLLCSQIQCFLFDKKIVICHEKLGQVWNFFLCSVNMSNFAIFGKVLPNCWCHDTGKTKTPCHIEQAKYCNKTRKLEPALSFISKFSPNFHLKNMILIFTKDFSWDI